MSVRDRYDVGKEKTYAADERAKYAREMLQQNTALHTIELASTMVRLGIAGSFEVELVAAWHEQRRQEGW